MKRETGWYFRWAPNFGFACRWFGGRRVRWAKHHGLQTVKWVNTRWYVDRQIAGRSRVKGEQHI